MVNSECWSQDYVTHTEQDHQKPLMMPSFIL